MLKAKKQIMTPFSVGKYTVAQRDDFSFVVTPVENPSKYLATITAEEVKPLSDNLLLIREKYFSFWTVYSISQKKKISLPIYSEIKASGKYFIFKRNKLYGVAVIAHDKFFEVVEPIYKCIHGISHGCIVFQDVETYGLHSIFSKVTITIKDPISIDSNGYIMTRDEPIHKYLSFAAKSTIDEECILVHYPFSIFYDKIMNTSQIVYEPLALKVYECDGKIQIYRKEIEDFLIKHITT